MTMNQALFQASAHIEALAQTFSDHLTSEYLVLYAGTNIASPRASQLLCSSLGAIPAMGRGSVREQPGVSEVAQIEAITEKLACEVFHGAWSEVRLQSCTLANLAIYASLCDVGDTIAVTPLSAGGHISHQNQGAPAVMRLNVMDLPFNDALQCIDDERSADFILQHRPRLIMLGASFVPRPFDFNKIVQAAKQINAVVVYDVAHTAGLIAGRRFPNPLSQGADLITASTYKTLGGPAGGLIVGNAGRADLEKRIRQAVFPWLTANYDAARVAALGVSLEEAKVHAEHYAHAMLENARALEAALQRHGIAVIPSQTHHLGLPRPDAAADSARLEHCGILCGTTAVSGQSMARGLRIGTQLITRRGFVPADMLVVADLVASALNGDDTQAVYARVQDMTSLRTRLQFTG